MEDDLQKVVEPDTVTVPESDWNLLKDGVIYYKKKYEEEKEEKEELKKQLTPQSLDTELLEDLRGTLGVEEKSDEAFEGSIDEVIGGFDGQ